MVEKIYARIKVKFHCDTSELKVTHVIYLLKFPNGKYYVGQTNTKFGLISRIQNHCYESSYNNKKRNYHKDNIIKKYKTFDVFILKKCSVENIDSFEMFYIGILKRKIVNIEGGGCNNKTVSEKTKEKLRKKIKKYHLIHPKKVIINVYDLEGNFIRSHETIKEIKEYYNVSSAVLDNALYKNNRIFLGQYQIFREGTEQIINYTKYNHNLGRKIRNSNEIFYKYDSLSGNFVDFIVSNKLNAIDRYCIKKAIKNNSLYDNCAWSLEKKDKIFPPKTHYEKVSEKLSKPVLQLDDNLNIIKKWSNVREAGEFYGDKKGELIRQVCIRWRKHTKGFTWCYEDEYEWYKSMWGEKLVRKR